MSEDKKIYACKDCVHAYRNLIQIVTFNYSEFSYRCRLTQKTKTATSNVTGKTVTEKEVSFCTTERNYGKCGSAGIFWKPRKKNDLFKLIGR